MSGVRVAVTDLARSVRCTRQVVLAREGLRVFAGGLGIGSAVHEVAESFLRRARLDDELRVLVQRRRTTEPELAAAISALVHRDVVERLSTLASRVRGEELVRFAIASQNLGRLFAALLLRAREAGVTAARLFDETLLVAERELEWTDAQGRTLSGRIDLLCRDHARGEVLVLELKTAMPDEAAADQARLYAFLLARSGERARPVVVHVGAEDFSLHQVTAFAATEGEVSARLATMDDVFAGRAVPAAASRAETCRACPVRAACWERWGRTLVEAESETSSAPTIAPAPSPLDVEAQRLTKTLASFNIATERVLPAEAIVGARVVRWRVRLIAGRRGRKRNVESVAEDVQREMDWSCKPLVTNAGTYLALDAPRSDPETIPFARFASRSWQGLEVPVGVRLDGTLEVLDLIDAPHVLVAGETGSGKSALLHAWLVALASRPTHERPLIYVLDVTKKIGFEPVKPLLERPPITEPEEGLAALHALMLEELPARQQLFAKHGVDDLARVPASERPRRIVVVIDEFADILDALAGDKAERSAFVVEVKRLLQSARAFGIHLVLATQRPSVDSVPGPLKSNLTVRIALRMQSSTDSRTVLDRLGAERLLGKGDLVIARDGGELVRAQALLVEPADVEEVARRMRP